MSTGFLYPMIVLLTTWTSNEKHIDRRYNRAYSLAAAIGIQHLKMEQARPTNRRRRLTEWLLAAR